MRFSFTKMLMFGMVFLSSALFAQQPMYDNLRNFTGTTGSNGFPFNSASSKVQYLYTPADFAYNGTAAVITKLYVLPHSSTASPATAGVFNFRIGMTNMSQFPSTDFILPSQMTTFHSGAYTFASAALAGDWLEISLNQPFHWDGVSNLIVEFAQQNIDPRFDIKTRASGVSNTRIYGSFPNLTGSRDGSVAVLGMDLFEVGSNNASVEQLISPNNFCAGNQNVSVRIANHGNNLINNVDIHWEINGIAQPTIAYTTAIDTFGSATGNTAIVNLGNYTFPAGNTNIKVYTSLPNGATDNINHDDTLTLSITPSMNGVYTIDPSLPLSATNYHNFTSLATDLNTFGICGPVVINVAANSGPYNERFVLTNINGTSAANRIRINGNGATLEYTNTAADRSLISLESTSFVTIDGLNLNLNATDYGWGVHFFNNCSFDSLVNCTITSASVSTSSSSNGGIIVNGSKTTMSSQAAGANNIFIGNNILRSTTQTGGMYYGIGLVGGSNLIAKNNEIENAYYSGVYINNIKNSVVENNIIQRATKTGVAAFRFIETRGSNNENTLVIGNRLHSPNVLNSTGSSSTSIYGLYLGGKATPATPMIIANNVIYNFNQEGVLYGIYMSAASGVKVVYNTVDFSVPLLSTGITYGTYLTGANTNSCLVNNVISITGGTTGNAFGYYFNGANPLAILDSIDNNNVFLGFPQAANRYHARTSATNFSSLPAFKAVYSTLDANSTDVNPFFINPSAGNFTPSNIFVVNGGKDISSIVSTDINGVTRSATPSMGAFEESNVANDNAGVDLVFAPDRNFCAGTQAVSAIVSNNGGNDITSVTVNWEVNGVAQTPLNYTNTIPSSVTSTQFKDTVTVGTFPFVAGNTYFIKVWTSNPNGVADIINSDDTSSVTVQPTEFAVNVLTDSLCSGKNVRFELSHSVDSVSTIQWFTSLDGTSFTPSLTSSGKMFDTLFTVNNDVWITASFNNNGIVCNTDSVAIKVFDPVLLSSVDGSRCGPGTVTLSGTASTGAHLVWYETATSYTSVGTGNTFVTPSISANQTYYVNAVVPSIRASISAGNTPSTNASTVGGLRFDVYNNILLKSVNVYPTTTGSFTLELRNSSNVVLESKVITITQANNPYVVNVDFYIPAGTSYYLMATGITGTTLGRNSSGSSYPYSSPEVLAITASYATSASTSAYNYFYDWKVETLCETPRVAVQATLTSAPAVVASATSSLICKGDNTTITGSSTYPGYTYEWLPTGQTGASITVNPTVTTEYILKGEDLTTGPFQGCTAFDTITVTVDSVPAPILTATPSTLCGGDTVTVSAIYNTHFDIGGNGSTTTGTPNPFVHAFGGYKYQYLVLASELTAAGFTAGDVMSGLSFDFTAANGSAFNDFSIHLAHTNATVVGGSFINSGLNLVHNSAAYVPAVGINPIPFNNAMFVWDGVSNLVVQTCWSNNNGGVSSNAPTVKYGTTPFVASAYARLDNASAATICGINNSNGTGSNRPWMRFELNVPTNIIYNWTPALSTSNTLVDVPTNYTTAPSSKNYTLQIGNANGCISSIVNTTILVNPQPTAIIQSNETTICANNNIGFYLDGSSSINATSYLWLADNSTAPTYLVKTGGNFVLQVTNSQGCNDWDTISITQITPTAPVINVTLLPGEATLDAGAGYNSYLWSTSEVAQTIAVTTSGEYFVTVEDANGCLASDTVNVTIDPNSVNSWNNVQLNLFPNPSNGQFTLSIAEYNSDNLRIDIYDVSGRIIYNQIIKETQNNMQIPMDMSNLSNGLYMLKVSSQTSAKTLRFSVVR